jgi:hypothetical protein
MVFFSYHSYIPCMFLWPSPWKIDRDPGSPDFLAMAFCMLVLQQKQHN